MFSVKSLTILPGIFLGIMSCLVVYSIAPDRLNYQLGFFLAGLAIWLVVKHLGSDIFVAFSPLLYILILLLLIFTLFLGVTVRGSSRWLDFGLFRLQTSEWAKAVLVLFLPWLAAYKLKIKNIIALFFLFGLVFFPVFFQPDLGSSLVLLVVFLAVFSLCQIKAGYKALFFAIMLIFIPLTFPLLKPYQQDRLIHFVNPYRDPSGAGYNVIQSIVAIGSGGFTGKGLGLGSQSQLHFLPEKQTDFIFASLVEELGFLGGGIVLVLYFWLFMVILNIYQQQEHRREKMIVMTVFMALFTQTVINIGMNMGIMPVTGLPLPLISVGGNSILVTFFMLGLIEGLPAGKPDKSILIGY